MFLSGKDYYFYIYVIMKYSVKPELITPTTFSDDVELLNCSKNLSLVQSNKPWFVYIKAHLNKSIIECLGPLKGKTNVNSMWRCGLHYQPIYQVMKKKLNKSCPPRHRIDTTNRLKYSAKLNLHILGKITTEKSYTLFQIWLNRNIPPEQPLVVQYLFNVHSSLALNVTFIKLQLLSNEIQSVEYGNCWKHCGFKKCCLWVSCTRKYQ